MNQPQKELHRKEPSWLNSWFFIAYIELINSNPAAAIFTEKRLRGPLRALHCSCVPYHLSCGFDTCGFLIENYKCLNYTIEDKERTMLFCPLLFC